MVFLYPAEKSYMAWVSFPSFFNRQSTYNFIFYSNQFSWLDERHYSQTRWSVPVANELINSLTEKWFRLLIQ